MRRSARKRKAGKGSDKEKMDVFGLHGFLGSPSDWDQTKDALQSDFSWLRWHSVSCWSGWKDKPPSLRDWARSFCQQVAATTQEKRILVGYSMGGRLALHALLEQPELWDGAVIISAHYGLQDETERAARRQHDATWAARFRTLPWNELMQAWEQQSVFGGPQKAPMIRQEADVDRSQLAGALETWSLGNQAYLLPALGPLREKLLWLVGTEDTKFCQLTETPEFLAQQIRTLRMEALGHRLPWQDPPRFLHVLRDFLLGTK